MTQGEAAAFLAVVKYGSISAAAEHLFLSQPALTRQLASMEAELGCALFRRQKGRRSVELTAEGTAFIPIAEKWQNLWREAKQLPLSRGARRLRLSAIGSVSTYLLPDIFHRYLAANPSAELVYHCYHSREAYSYAEEGETDFAFVSDLLFSKTVTPRALFSDAMELVSATPLHGPVSTDSLDPRREIRVPWNPEYDSWHSAHFREETAPQVFLDEMPMMEGFLAGDAWSIVPASMAEKLQRKGLYRCALRDGPAGRVVYGLRREGALSPELRSFLLCAREAVAAVPGVTVYSDNWL